MLMSTVDRYLSLRRALGYKLRNTESHLRHFARFSAKHGDSFLRSKTAIAFALEASSTSQRDYIIRDIARFGLYAITEDARHEIPPADMFRIHRPRPTPYIFSEHEIRLIMKHARRLGPEGSLRPHTYKTLIGLLASTGLRISEAVSLNISDFEQNALTIRQTKFQKNRLVPLHTTTLDALNKYLVLRRQVEGTDPHLFVSMRRKKLCCGVVQQTFRKILSSAGIVENPEGPKPRLHSFRHTFAVRNLEKCRADRDSVTRHMIALSTYMGHSEVQSTYWYLESTPSLLADIADTCDDFLSGGDS